MATSTAKYKPYPAYRPSLVEWLGEVPSHWEDRRLKYSAPIRVGKLDRKPEEATYVGLEHIESWTGRLLLNNQPESVDSVVGFFVAGDVLFGKLRPYLAKSARPDFDGVATSEILALRPQSDCWQSYVMYCLLSEQYVRWINVFTYGAKMPRVSPDQVGISSMPLPPLPEQRAIAAFLDWETAKIDSLVAKKERLIELLQEKRNALISRAVTRGLDPDVPMKGSGVDWLGVIPGHWQVMRLARITECLDGQRVPLNAEERSYMQGVYPYWGANSIVDYIDRWLFDEELVLIGEDGAPFFDPKREVAFTVSGKVWVNNHAHVLRPRPQIQAPFLSNVLNCVDYAAFIDGTTRDKLTQGDMNVIPVQVPPLVEQRAITSYLDNETAKLEALIDKVREAIQRLNELRASLISAAVTGRIDVRGEAV